MKELYGKKLLILGGTYSSYDLVKIAKEMGIHTIVTDNNATGVAKEIADETANISTADMDSLVELIKEKNIDGVFSGPSEFNLRNVINLCELTGLPCYTSTQVWDRCANKDVFKSYCRDYNVDCTPEYDIDINTPMEELKKIEYPIIIKPVDGCSSVGISVCRDETEVYEAIKRANEVSKSKKIIAEKYIENKGEIFSIRYLIRDGEAYPYFMMDTYVVNPFVQTGLVSAFTFAPSKYGDYYMKNMDRNVREMFKGIGLKNGTAFIQALPYKGRIYFHEMGYRLSGGMLFKLTQPLVGVNDMKMMLKTALGYEMFSDKEVEAIDLLNMKKIGAQLMIPLNAGIIGKIVGLEEAKQLPFVTDFIQYYKEKSCIEEKYIGTLQQHFGRFSIIADNEQAVFDTVKQIQSVLKIYDTQGNDMCEALFDINRINFQN